MPVKTRTWTTTNRVSHTAMFCGGGHLDMDTLLSQYPPRQMGYYAIVFESGASIAYLQECSITPRELTVEEALEIIDQPIITRESAAEDAAFIAELRRRRPMPKSDFVPLPMRRQ